MIRATFAGFGTALSALQANQKRLDITGQNLSNMNTVGYTRQQLETSSLNYTGAISHYMNGSEVSVGFGVSIDRVSQIRDPYLDAQYRLQMTKSSYSSSMQESLDSLANILDESNISGIRQAFDNIQSTLTNMQDTPNANDLIYESELRSRMQALTNLLNSASQHITDSEKAEYDKLNGEGTSEQGAVQKVNDILRQLGDLNVQIKKNQVLGQPSLELMDERNVLLDELSSYVPIEVTYFKDEKHSGTYEYTYADGTKEIRDRMYDYDKNGNIIGKRNWPDDMRVELLYTDTKGNPQRLTLVNGSNLGADGQQKNYGELTAVNADRSDPTALGIQFSAAPSTAAAGAAAGTTTASASGSQFESGSIQSGLDMLGKAGTGNPIPNTNTLDDVRGYEYYRGKLDNLAKSFATVMNKLNNQYKDADGNTSGDLFAAKDGAADITAGNIGISTGWIDGTVHVSTNGRPTGGSPTDTILNMLNAMTKPYGSAEDIDGDGVIDDVNLEDKSFADYMNNVSTILANDSSSNQVALKTNVTVLNGVQDSRDSVSGVSMDEEATNMMTYVSAYNAASRLMTAMDEVLNTLINSTGLVGR